jgi:hypothetical protein
MIGPITQNFLRQSAASGRPPKQATRHAPQGTIRHYAGADTGRLTADFYSSGLTASQAMSRLPTLRNRAQELERSNPYVKRFVKLSEQNIVGPAGVRLHSVPQEANGLRDKLAARNILGTRVLLFEQDDLGFVPAERWPGNALATTTTHDLPTIKGWLAGHDLEWRVRAGQHDAQLLEGDHAERAGERVALRQLLERQGMVSGGDDDACLQACIEHIGRTPAPLALLPLEDACGLEQQPNLPGPGDIHPNWRRRYPLAVSELLEQPATSARLAALDGARREAGHD